MKRILAATVMTVALTLTPAPAQAHTIYCAAYVGNPCYKTAAVHRCVHAALARVTHRSRTAVVRVCVAQVKRATR